MFRVPTGVRAAERPSSLWYTERGWANRGVDTVFNHLKLCVSYLESMHIGTKWKILLARLCASGRPSRPESVDLSLRLWSAYNFFVRCAHTRKDREGLAQIPEKQESTRFIFNAAVTLTGMDVSPESCSRGQRVA